MVVNMMKWRPWPPIQTLRFQVRLVLKGLSGLEVESLGGKATLLAAEVRWKGRPRTPLGPLRRSVRRNCTRGVEAAEGGVEWNEEFYCACDLVGHRDGGGFYPWEVALIVFDGSDDGSMNKISVVGTTLINLGEYALAAQEKEMEICVPLLLAGSTNEPELSLNFALSFVELRTSQDSSEIMPKITSLVPAPLTSMDASFTVKDEPSAVKASLRKVKTANGISNGKKKKSGRGNAIVGIFSMRNEDAETSYPFDSDSLDDDNGCEEWEDDKENCNAEIYSYGTLAAANYIGGSVYSEMRKNGNYDDWVYYSNRRCDGDCSRNEEPVTSPADLSLPTQTLKRSILPWQKRRSSFKSPKCKGEPLLKCYGEEGGDDIDFDRRIMSSSDESLGWQNISGEMTVSSSSVSKFGDDDFAVGRWETKEILSRDGKLKLCTQIFFASIDQRSERAAGESACTALVAVIADWIENNPDIMPTQSEFDSLIREGSSEWRKLCCNEAYQEQFPDKHFDLETVLQAKVRPLCVVPDKSFVGFFHPEGISTDNTRFEFLNGALSFENIWDAISEVGFMNLYIVSWNDHFFILKVETDVYYIIDTLGERLFEGCKQAYILRFDKDTKIQRVVDDENNPKSSTDETSKPVNEQEQPSSTKDLQVYADDNCLYKGKESCKEYIKSFLAALPMRELLADLKKGLMSSTPLHQVLQVDFHFTELSKEMVLYTEEP